MGLKEEREGFWLFFREHAVFSNEHIGLRRTSLDRHYQDLSTGIRYCHLAAVCLIENEEGEQELRAEFVVGDRKAYERYFANRALIENRLRASLEWPPVQHPDDLFRIVLHGPSPIDLEQREKWGEYCNWLCDRADELYAAFSDF